MRFVGFPNEPDLFKVVHSADSLRRFGRWLRLVFGSRAELTIPAISVVIDGEKCCSRAGWNRNDVKDPFFGFHDTVAIAQLVRASDCDSEGRGFESPYPPLKNRVETSFRLGFFVGSPTTG